MSSLIKAVAAVVVVLAVGVGLAFWKSGVAGQSGSGSLNKITKEDMALILKDADPSQLQSIGDNPEAKKKIAENIKQLLAVASQARKDGLAEEPNTKLELESIRSIVTASLYDKKINEGKGPMPPFSFITEDQIKEFTAKPAFETEFKGFPDSKVALAQESGRLPKDKPLTEEQVKGARDDYAKIRIYQEEAGAKKAELGEEFARNLELQVKLQQAQFLASRYAQKTLVEKAKVTDEDIKKYIAEHPEYSTTEKKTQAEQILSRAKAGEDFAKLSDEFSQDPGTKGKGGLYEGVTMGKMVPAFEQAAVALEPGKIADNLVETPYGYHIIKLEKKGEAKGADGQAAPTYDVRHILITTAMKDPKDPMGREKPINDMVKTMLEGEKQKQVLDEILKNNPVEVAEDFEIPKPTEEELKQMQEQEEQMMQQQMPGGPGGMPVGPGGMPPPPDPKGKTPPAKPEPKK